MNNMGTLFFPEPERWGLRGDPFLWREMAEQLRSRQWPASAGEFTAILHDTFAALTGHAVSFSGPIHLPRHSHGGMSSGSISTAFWREHGFVLLVSRFEKAQH